MSARRRVLWAALAAAAVAAYRERTDPSPCPFAQRWLLHVPRPGLTPGRLRQILEPVPGERMLELGPGDGYHTPHVAEWIGPDGTLEAVDIQEKMLESLMSRARKLGIANITPTVADARELPFPDASFDAAYLVTVLGEVPDQAAALRELRRVLKPSGRLVVGEIPPLDPHFVSFGALRERAEREGFTFDRRLGPSLSYFARFRPS
jgi:SAM-dependent methyltransferase